MSSNTTILLLVSIIGGLYGCNTVHSIQEENKHTRIQEYQEQEQDYNNRIKQTEGIQDCTMKIVTNSSGVGPIKIIRCPLSSTTVTSSCGKNCTSTETTIEQ